MTYLAFVLDEPSRARLLQRVPPTFAKVIAHHVTLLSPKTDEATLRRTFRQLEGQVHDVEAVNHYKGDHIEAVGVSFNSDTRRPKIGGFYHVTLSLEAPAKPYDSNMLTNATPVAPFKLTGSVQLVD